MVQLPGFEVENKNLVYKINKALYGLKQAPKLWFDKLKFTLTQFGFQASKCDPSLFWYQHQAHTIFILVYMDDIIITGNSSSLISLFYSIQVELQLNKKIKTLQTDEGKKYIAFSKFLKKNGIQNRFSCAYTHEQNGSAERKHRHLTETGLT
uniref:Retrovirus-related Pol polyprotein from transposon TNT 1-94 n=1 Tax=Cajanus cajan TaxID=3821 RepID=A0A151RWL7_CAJCA|nr:Retrovirus-related Pol polyprotein from transposon TNT 1-94 [Cajanus cajan]